MAVPDPLIALAEAVRKADRRWCRACDARDEAEKACGGPYHYLPPRIIVSNYECTSPRMILSACQPHAPNGPTAEEGQALAGQLRLKIRAYRRRRLAAGLGPYDREVEQAERAYYAGREALSTTPAITVAGLAVKLRMIRNDFRDGGSDHSGPILRSALRDAERLAGKAVAS